MPSPTPIFTMGSPSSWLTASAMPPLAVPSSFVTIRASKSSARLNSRACCRPFWPVVASMTSTVYTGSFERLRTTFTTFSSSRMRSAEVCRRPAVSMSTSSAPVASARSSVS